MDSREKVYKYTVSDQEIFENIFKDENILMNHVIIPPGKVFPKHPADANVYVLIIKGNLSLGIENEAGKIYPAGHLIYIPKGLVTELGNRGPDILELFVVKHE